MTKQQLEQELGRIASHEVQIADELKQVRKQRRAIIAMLSQAQQAEQKPTPNDPPNARKQPPPNVTPPAAP